MEIRHKVSFDRTEDVRRALDALGIEYVAKGSPVGSPGKSWLEFQIFESDPRWNAVNALIQQNADCWDRFNTYFTEEEVRAAAWCRLMPRHQDGYPEPSRWSIDKSYTYTDPCKCGVRGPQHSPFRVERKPRLEGNQFMILYWTCEFFATPTVFSVFASEKVTGYEEWPLLCGKQVVPALTQISIPKHTKATYLPEATHAREICSQCKTVRYNPHVRGPMQFTADLLEEEADLIRSQEWFGSGYRSNWEILASQRVVRLILGKGWRGVDFQPLQIVE